MFVMLFISVLTQIPELNLARLFSLEMEPSCDPERQLLAESAPAAGSQSGHSRSGSNAYTRQIDDDEPSLQQQHHSNGLPQPTVSKY